MNPRLRAALHYARQGWPVLPCAPDGKALCDHGVLDASTDEAVIQAWWTRWPRAGVGTTGVVVLDVTGREGERTLAALEEKYGELPETRTVGTAQGRQFHFLPNGSVVSSDGGKLGPHVNVLRAAQSVLLPPSADESGVRCEWLSLAKPAPLPAWVAQVVAIPESQQRATLSSPEGTTGQRDRKIEATKAFLLKALGNGPVSSKELQDKAKVAGISERTVFRAKALLHIKAVRSGFGQGGAWAWELPSPHLAAYKQPTKTRPKVRSSVKPDISMHPSKAVSLKNVAANGKGNGSLSTHVAIPIMLLGAEQQSATPTKGSA